MRLALRIFLIFVISFGSFLIIIFLTRPKPVAHRPFNWGITINPYPTFIHNRSTANQVIDRAVTLGLNTVRLAFPASDSSAVALTDPVVDLAYSHKLNIVMTIDPPYGFDKLTRPYTEGYNEAFYIADHYKNKVSFYQLTNEPGGTVIKSSWSGITQDAYDDAKYKVMIAWLKGAADGVKAANPTAKRVITGHWLQVGFFERVIKDGLNFEVIGWDWFNEKTPIDNLSDGGKPFDLITKLASFNKELWISEAGLNGSQASEQEVASYLNAFAQKIYNRTEFSGFFGFTLIDEGHLIGTDGQYNGLVGLTRDPNASILAIGEPKPAFAALQKVIKNTQ